MRGILPGKSLAYLEQALRSKSGDPDARISDYFDIAAGTGVGGVFAAILFSTCDGLRPLFRADDTWRFLSDHGNRLLGKAPPSSPSSSSSPGFLCGVFRGGGCGGGASSATLAMERVMKEAFGEKLTLRNTIKPVLIPCYDLQTSAPLVFSRADALESQSYDFRLWEVCRATWAIPGHFKPAEMQSVDRTTSCIGVDGGLAMSNSAAAAITHVLHNKQEFPFVRGAEDLLVLSLGYGAGGAVPAVPGEEQRRARRWSSREWTRPVARIAADGAADLIDQAVALALENCAEHEALEDPSVERTFEGHRVPPWREQLTARALVVSFLLSVMFSVIVMKLNLTTGIIPSLNVTGLLGFFFVKLWTKALEHMGLLRTPFTRQENTVIQTCVVAAYGLDRFQWAIAMILL